MRFNKSFQSLWAGQTFGVLASTFVIMGLVTFVYKETQSATIAAFVPMIRVSAMLLSGIVAPLLLDRYRLHKILAAALAGQTGLLLAIIVFMFTAATAPPLPVMGVFLFLSSFLDGWTSPARNALVPRLIPQQELLKANSVLGTTEQIVQLVGWSIGGMLAARLGWEFLLELSGLLLFISTICTLFIRDLSNNKWQRHAAKSGWQPLKDGWVTIWKSPVLRTVSLMDILEGIANGVWIGALILVYVTEVLHRGEDWWGYINGSFFAGTLLGGFLVIYFAKLVNRWLLLSMITASLIVSLLTFCYALTSSPAWALILCLLMGPAFQTRDIAQRTLFQQSVNQDLLPKVLSAQGSLIYATFGISVLVMGAISDWLGIRAAYLVAAGLFTLSASMAFLMVRKGGTRLQQTDNA